jgi:hypothetical protein
MAACVRVMFRQPSAQARRLGPHDRIPLRVVIGTAAEDLVRDQRFFEFLVTSLEMAIDEKRQESRHARVSREPGARENVRKLGADVSRGRRVGMHDDLKNRSDLPGAANV